MPCGEADIIRHSLSGLTTDIIPICTSIAEVCIFSDFETGNRACLLCTQLPSNTRAVIELVYILLLPEYIYQRLPSKWDFHVLCPSSEGWRSVVSAQIFLWRRRMPF